MNQRTTALYGARKEASMTSLKALSSEQHTWLGLGLGLELGLGLGLGQG